MEDFLFPVARAAAELTEPVVQAVRAAAAAAGNRAFSVLTEPVMPVAVAVAVARAAQVAAEVPVAVHLLPYMC